MGVFVVCYKRRKAYNESDGSGYPGPPTSQPYPTNKADSTEGTPPPEYCPRPADTHQRARVKSRFNQNPDGESQPGTGPGNPANRSLDKSGYADLGLGYDAVSTNAMRGNEAGETSMNRSLHHSPRRANQPTDGAPLGYVNRTFTDDTGVSDQPTGGRPRSLNADDAADGTASSDAAVPKRRGRRTNRSLDDSTAPAIPVQEVTDWSEGGLKPSLDAAARPDGGGFMTGLPQDTGHGTSGTPPGSHPGDRSFEIVNPGFDAEELVPRKPLEKSSEARKNPRSYEPSGYPRNNGRGSAFDPVYPQREPVPTPRMAGGVGSFENLVVPPKVDARLNRSFDPSSYLPDRSLANSAAGTRQGSAPDVRQRAGNATVHFNTAAQAIDV